MSRNRKNRQERIMRRALKQQGGPVPNADKYQRNVDTLYQPRVNVQANAKRCAEFHSQSVIAEKHPKPQRPSLLRRVWQWFLSN